MAEPRAGSNVTARQDLEAERRTFSYDIDLMQEIAAVVVSREAPLRAFLTYVNPRRESRILDVGCGTGNFAVKLSMLGFRSVRGVDVAESRIRNAKRKAEFLGQGDVVFEAISLQDLHAREQRSAGRFDIVTTLGCIHHFPDPLEPLGLIHDLLADDGLLYAYEPNALSPWDIIRGQRKFCVRTGTVAAAHGSPNERFFTPAKFRKCLVGAGFKEVEVLANFYHPGVTRLLAKVPVLGLLSRAAIALARK